MAIVSDPDANEPAPARHRVNVVLLYICAALGGFIAAIADIAQKDEASAVTKLTRLSAKSFNATLEPHVILLTVVVLAALLCMVFQPRNRTSAFAVGLGTIAVVMTGTPYTPPKTGAPRLVPQAETMWRGGGSEYASLDASGWSFPPDIRLAQVEGSSIVFHVKVEQRVGATLTISLFDPATGEEYRQRYQLGEPGMFAVVFELAGGGTGQDLQYTAELDGFRLASGTLDRKAGEITLDADALATKADIPSGRTIDDLNLIDRVRRNIFKDYRF